MSDQGFQNQGFRPEPANHGFQPSPTDQGFQPHPTDRGFQQGGFQEMINMDEMMAFTRGSAAGVPVGYDIGIAHGAAKASSGAAPELFSQLGFIDTKESKAYGQGYQYGWAQGYSLGYVQSLTKQPQGGFTDGGFKNVES